MQKAANPMSQRALGQHFVGQQRRSLGRATRATGGTETALLATECDQFLGVAVLATHAQETFPQATALQIGI